ncbi:MAG: NAD(P)-dependent oxidoreductase [Spirochaetes bacterium]|nr:NAD(P)-dependent oxidoreductase [Spirochaetota bacterium]
MKLRILLWALGRMMLRASKKNADFKKLAGDSVYQLMTSDGGVVRHYAFSEGGALTAPAPHPKPACTITFRDARYGFSVLTSKDKNAFLEGLRRNDIAIDGGLHLLMKFQKLAGMLRGGRRPALEASGPIGFVGAGFIGAPMARSLMRAGFAVKVSDTSPAALGNIARDGAIACASLADMAGCRAVIVMVNNMAQVNQVVDGLCAALPKDTAMPIIVMSTVSPDDVRELRGRMDAAGRKSLQLMDAPVSGAPMLAEAGKLSIMAGGDREAFDAILPILQAMGDPEKIFHMGPLGSGEAIKLVNNIIGLAMGLIVCESMDLGVRKGMDPDLMARVINESTGKNFLTDQWPFTKMMFEAMLGDTTYNAKEALFVTGSKDLETAKKWAEKSGIKIRSADDALGQIRALDGDEVTAIVKRLLKKG